MILNNYRAQKQNTLTPVPASSTLTPPSSSIGDPQALLDAYRAKNKVVPDQNVPDNRNILQKGAGIVLDPIVKLATEAGNEAGKGILKGAELFQSPEQKAKTEAGINYAESQGSNVPVLGTSVKPLKDITAKDVGGQLLSTAGIFTGNPALGGAALGAGGSLEQGNDLLSIQTLFQTVLGAGGGKILDLIGKPLLDGAGKVIGKITPEYLKSIASKGGNAISEFAANHNLLPQGARNVLDKATELQAKTNAGVNNLFKGASTAAKDIATKQFPESFGLLTKEGQKNATTKATEDLTKGLVEKNPETEALYAKKQQDFHDTMRDILDQNPNIRANAGITRAETKLNNLANRSGDPNSETSVLKEIFDNGQLDGVGKDGRFKTDEAQTRQTQKIKDNAALLDTQLKSSNHKIDGGNIGNSFENSIANGKNVSNSEITAAENLRNDYPILKNGSKATPSDMYDLSKKLRADAYNARTGLLADTAKADRLQNLAGKIDEYLRNKIPDLNSSVTNKLIDNQTRAYAARNVLSDLSKIKVPTSFGKKITSLVGSVAGYSHAGFLGAGLGKIGAEKVFDSTMEAFTNKRVASEVMQRFAQNANKQEIAELKALVDKNVSQNIKDKSIRDFYDAVEKKNAAKVAGARKFAQEGNVGTKYPVTLPTIEYPKSPKVKSIKDSLPSIQF